MEVEECLFQLLSSREFENQAGPLIKYQELLPSLLMLQVSE